MSAKDEKNLSQSICFVRPRDWKYADVSMLLLMREPYLVGYGQSEKY